MTSMNARVCHRHALADAKDSHALLSVKTEARVVHSIRRDDRGSFWFEQEWLHRIFERSIGVLRRRHRARGTKEQKQYMSTFISKQ